VMKGLPLAYSKDMQEDKEAVFDAADTLDLMIAAMTGMVGDMVFHEKRMRKAAATGFSTATDLADWLVRELNIPFRDAHHITGKAVALAEAKNTGLETLTLADMQSIHEGITENVFSVLTVEKSVRSRTSFGGTAPSEVKKQIAAAKRKLAKQ
jgi:argininosuccinate lyase